MGLKFVPWTSMCPSGIARWRAISHQENSPSALGYRLSARSLETNGKLETVLRLGFRMVRGMRQEVAHAIVRERQQAPFASIDDLVRRVPSLRKSELTMLAQIG